MGGDYRKWEVTIDQCVYVEYSKQHAYTVYTYNTLDKYNAQ